MNRILPSEDDQIIYMALRNYEAQLIAELEGVTNPDVRINIEWRIERVRTIAAKHHRKNTLIEETLH